MNQTTRHRLAAVALTILVSGCYADTAQWTLGEAYKNACKGKVEELRQVLRSSALEQFGTTDGAREVCASVDAASHKKVKLEDKLIYSNTDRFGFDTFRSYTVDLVNKETRATLATATVDCDVHWYRERVTPYAGPYPGPIVGPYPPVVLPPYGYPRYPRYPRYRYDLGYRYEMRDTENCFITSFKN